mmetsp:Transcript_142457/g.442969  ORF Transcript_142457/g.442969 Transcript_142457/m.442969 type:complete len:302 (-) Transcript_142457:762-1667(-)
MRRIALGEGRPGVGLRVLGLEAAVPAQHGQLPVLSLHVRAVYLEHGHRAPAVGAGQDARRPPRFRGREHHGLAVGVDADARPPPLPPPVVELQSGPAAVVGALLVGAGLKREFRDVRVRRAFEGQAFRRDVAEPHLQRPRPGLARPGVARRPPVDRLAVDHGEGGVGQAGANVLLEDGVDVAAVAIVLIAGVGNFLELRDGGDLLLAKLGEQDVAGGAGEPRRQDDHRKESAGGLELLPPEPDHGSLGASVVVVGVRAHVVAPEVGLPLVPSETGERHGTHGEGQDHGVVQLPRGGMPARL